MFMNHCTLLYIVLLRVFSMVLVHTGAPYSIRGRMAPLYMVSSVACFNPQVNFADLASVCISVEHFLDVCVMCSQKVSFLSMRVPKYLMVFSCSRGLLFKYIDTSVFSLLFLLVTTMTLDFFSLKVILLSCPFHYFIYLYVCVIFSFSYSFCPYCY